MEADLAVHTPHNKCMVTNGSTPGVKALYLVAFCLAVICKWNHKTEVIVGKQDKRHFSRNNAVACMLAILEGNVPIYFH